MRYIITLAMFCVLMGASDARACSCQRLADKDDLYRAKAAMQDADAIFAGYAQKVTKKDGDLVVEFQVRERWKGKDMSDILTIKTSIEGSMCGYPFEAKRHYLVFAYGTKYSLSTHLCSPTAPIALSEGLLGALGPPMGHKKPPEVIKTMPEVMEK